MRISVNILQSSNWSSNLRVSKLNVFILFYRYCIPNHMPTRAAIYLQTYQQMFLWMLHAVHKTFCAYWKSTALFVIYLSLCIKGMLQETSQIPSLPISWVTQNFATCSYKDAYAKFFRKCFSTMNWITTILFSATKSALLRLCSPWKTLRNDRRRIGLVSDPTFRAAKSAFQLERYLVITE